MKVMVVSSLYAPIEVGGAEKSTRRLGENLVERGHSVVVVTTVPAGKSQTRELHGVRVHDVALRNVYWPYDSGSKPSWLRAVWHALDTFNPWMTAEVGRLIDLEKPDVLHTHNLTGFSTGVWSVAESRGVPVLHTLHDFALLCPRTTMYSNGAVCTRQCGKCKAFTLPARSRSHRVDAVVGVSNRTLERHIDAGYFSQSRVKRVIHNGLPPLEPGPPAPSPAAGGPMRLGYVGRLAEPKGIRQLILAMREFDPEVCTLEIAGRGSDDYECELRALAGPNVRFLGFIDPSKVYRSVNALVVPSLWEEPLGNIVLEAYQHGVPVIASRRGGLPDIVEHTRTGLLYEPTDPAGLSDAIRTALAGQGLRERMRGRILQKSAHFTAERVTDEYLEVLGALARPDLLACE